MSQKRKKQRKPKTYRFIARFPHGSKCVSVSAERQSIALEEVREAYPEASIVAA